MGPFVWFMDGPLMKAEWRSASMECGGQCVTLVGVAMMQELCADNWVTASAQVHKVEQGIRLIIYKDVSWLVQNHGTTNEIAEWYLSELMQK